MNRQLRRAQEKQDKKQEKEKQRRRDERRAKVKRLRSERQARRADTKEASSETKPRSRGRNPGRFAGVLAIVTVFFISLQGVAPAETDEGLGASFVAAGFYLMLGYFGTLWFMRRGMQRAVLTGVAGGILLAVSVAAAQLLRGQALDPLALALTVPALILGALLGRLVYRASPA